MATSNYDPMAAALAAAASGGPVYNELGGMPMPPGELPLDPDIDDGTPFGGDLGDNAPGTGSPDAVDDFPQFMHPTVTWYGEEGNSNGMIVMRNPDGSSGARVTFRNPEEMGRVLSQTLSPSQLSQVVASNPTLSGGVRAATGGAGGGGGSGGGGGISGADTSSGHGGYAEGSVNNPYDPGPNVDEGGNLPPVGGADPGGGGNETTLSGVDDPGRRYTGEGYFQTPEGLLDFLPDNYNEMTQEQRLQALIGAVTRRQEEGYRADLAGFDAAQQERLARGAGVRALEDRILGDTDVMDEATIQRISGATTAAANNKANVLGQALAERRAAAGSSRSGSAQTEQAAVLTNAMQQAIQAESDTRAQARQMNFQSRNQALQSVGQSQRADVGLGAQIAQGRANVDDSVVGDAFTAHAGLNTGGQTIRVAMPGGGTQTIRV